MTEKLKTLRDHLQQISDMMEAANLHNASLRGGKPSERPFSSQYDFVLKEGIECEYTGNPRPKGCGVRKMQDQQCFRNAHIVAMRLPERYAYVEGFALGMIPVPHAWLIDMDGKVVDPTWNKETCAEYIGVPLDLRYVNRIILSREVYGVVDNWEHDWPILVGDHTPDDYRDKRFPRKADQ